MPTLRSFFGGIRSLYRRMFQRQEDAHLRSIKDTLRKVVLFQHLSNTMLGDLADSMHVRDYKRDEYIYYEGDPGLGVYIIQRGRVRLLTEDEETHEHEIRQVGDHEIFGDISILGVGDIRRLESAQAVSETRVLGFFSPELKTMLRRNPRTGAVVIVILARHLAVRQDALLELIAGQEGKVAAMRMLNSATERARTYSTEVPASR